ncbi:MAG: hypothetical protein DRG82_17170, partial [Deltaproteobacteria bacterium]
QEGDTLEFTVSAYDAAGTELEVISSSLPEGASLTKQSSYTFFWVPGYDQSGQYWVSFLASDGLMSSQQDVVINVADRNRPPEIFEIKDQEVDEGSTISFEITATDPDGDPVTISIDSTETPYIQSADIRNNSVFVFNTALLDKNVQIPSAVFKVVASDGRGGEDRISIAFKITRKAEVEVPSIDPGGGGFTYQFPGTGLHIEVSNQGSSPVSGTITGKEVSGELTGGAQGTTTAQLAAEYSYLAKSKDKVVVRPFLSADATTGGDFYGLRRGWGLDLSTAMLANLGSLKFDITLVYEDRDIPARDIPEFSESAISVFGLDANGNFVQLATVLDTAKNTATAQADLSLYSDYTLGVILDLDAPVISGTSRLLSTTDESGPYVVTTTIVDNVLVSSAKLYYALEGEQFQVLELKPVPGQLNLYSAEIPGQKEGSTVLYYVEAGDSLHTVTDPADAPQSTFRFSVLMDGVQTTRAGDVDNNGKVDIFDLLGVLKILGGSQGASGGADANQDGKVDIFDLLEILKTLSR